MDLYGGPNGPYAMATWQQHPFVKGPRSDS